MIATGNLYGTGREVDFWRIQGQIGNDLITASSRPNFKTISAELQAGRTVEVIASPIHVNPLAFHFAVTTGTPINPDLVIDAEKPSGRGLAIRFDATEKQWVIL